MANILSRRASFSRGVLMGTALLASACAALPEAQPSDSLIGAWQVEDVNGAGVVDRSLLTVDFSETGQISGSAGCNRFTGAYDLQPGSDTLRVTPLGVTRRMCLEALMTQEARFVSALQSATRVEKQYDGAVALTSSQGRVLLRRRGRAAETASVKPLAPTATESPASTSSSVTPYGAAPPSPATPNFSTYSTAAADPLAPQPAGAPLFGATPPSALPPPSTSSYPLAGGSAAAPLYPAPSPAPTYTSPAAIAPPYTPPPSTPQPSAPPTSTAPAYAPALSPAPSPAPATRITASGEITLADALPLPADATLRVQIRDVSRAGAPATVLGEQSTPAASGSPWPFSVSAPSSVVAPNARLSVFAQVLSGNRLLYISDSTNPLPVAGASGMSIRLANATPVSQRPAPRPGAAPAYSPPANTPPAYTPPPSAPSTGVLPVTPAWNEYPNAVSYRCRNETFRISIEERVAYLITSDGAVARLARIGVAEDPGAPAMFSNNILTVVKQSQESGGDLIRFGRGRAALTNCTAQ
jgi:heat shock protein HslJ/uncharacterized lipoprotein YbaY